MKLSIALLVLLASSVNADLSNIDHDLDVNLGHIVKDFSHFFNVTETELINHDHPHAHLNVVELGAFYNYGSETHTIYTEDGHILEMHRYTGNHKNPDPKGKQPVLLVHGILCSSMDWTIAGPGRGLAFILADLGYDVWMGNVRGNKYSRRHLNISISESALWDFSFHEMGKYDLPTMIDYVLKKTKYEKLIYLGHSQGSTAFMVMLSELPEYNDKIITMFSLAPVAYCSHMNSPIFRILAAANPLLDVFRRYFGMYEFNPTNEFFQKFTSIFCDKNSLTQPICTNIIFMICGYSDELMDKELLPAILAHFPAGSSTKQFIHYAQLFKSGHFRQYDYGAWTNLDKYNKSRPPVYNLSNVKVPISIHYGVNDWLSNAKDVHQLSQELPNVIGKFRVPHEKFNHLDFLWGKNAKTLLYDRIIHIMKRQEKLNAKKPTSKCLH